MEFIKVGMPQGMNKLYIKFVYMLWLTERRVSRERVHDPVN
jgi:predicted cation transporter